MKTTLNELFIRYLDRIRSLNYSSETIYSVQGRLRRFVNWLANVHGVGTADRLRARHLHGYQSNLANHHTAKGMPLKPGTINNHVKAVRQFTRFLHEGGLLTRNLAECISHVKEPKMLPTSVLEHNEIRSVLRKLDTTTPIGYRNRTVLELLYSSGIRGGELFSLTASSIDLKNGLLRVLGKGSKERVVPAGKTAMHLLEGYIKAIRPFWPGCRNIDALFLSLRGNPLSHNTLKNIVKRAFPDASVHVTAHTFRRSCTTELIRHNANIYHVKELLGHASLASLAPYTKLTIADLKKTHSKCHPREKDNPNGHG